MKKATGQFDEAAQRLRDRLPKGRRIAVIGSTDFWHPETEKRCTVIGQLLAGIDDLVLLTGGVEGIGEAIGRAFFNARRNSKREPLVFHVLPEGEQAWDYGVTMFGGKDMTERREILGRLSLLYLAVEGGPGTGHEIKIAVANQATIIPLGRSGGFAGEHHGRSTCPSFLDIGIWRILGSAEATPEEAAIAVYQAVNAFWKSFVENKE